MEIAITSQYDLAKIGAAWKIYDVKIENASIVTTYRSQFNDTIQKDGVSGLISQLQTKADALKTTK
jgi:phospholipid transport system substrate-binding protein